MSSLVGGTGKIISLGNDLAITIVAKKLSKKIDDKDNYREEWFDCGAEFLT